MQRRKAKVTSHKALLRMPKHPLNSSGSAGRVRPEQLRSLDFPKEGFNNATPRKKDDCRSSLFCHLGAGGSAVYPVTDSGNGTLFVPLHWEASLEGWAFFS